MAGIESEFEALKNLVKGAQSEAVMALEDAAAQVYLQAIRSETPRRTGQLAASARVFEIRDRRAIMGQNRRRLLVGPERKKGYYGYFIDQGYTAMGRRRRERAATATTHSQKGSSGGRKIPGTGWFERLIRNADAAAEQAAEAAFNQKLSEIDSRLG